MFDTILVERTLEKACRGGFKAGFSAFKKETQDKLVSLFFPFYQLEDKAQNQENYRDLGLGIYKVGILPYILDFTFCEIKKKSPYS